MERGSYVPVDMLGNLALVERQLLGLLKQSPDKWHTLDVDYEPPRVERCWCEIEGDLRVMLHKIHPCDKALYHPHPWPSAIRIVTGIYEMGVAFADPDGVGNTDHLWKLGIAEAAKLILTKGASYEMVDPMAWHYVRPLKKPSLSVMVIGRPWPEEDQRYDHSKFGKGIKHQPLKDDRRDSLLDEFHAEWMKCLGP